MLRSMLLGTSKNWLHNPEDNHGVFWALRSLLCAVTSGFWARHPSAPCRPTCAGNLFCTSDPLIGRYRVTVLAEDAASMTRILTRAAPEGKTRPATGPSSRGVLATLTSPIYTKHEVAPDRMPF